MICVAESRLIKKAAPIALLCLLSFKSHARHNVNGSKESRIVVEDEAVSTVSIYKDSKNQEIPEFSWNESRKLTWKDFVGSVDYEDEQTAAATYCGIGLESKMNEASEPVSIKVYNRFFPAKSWVRPGELKSTILAHEQCHFDICELYTRILKSRVAKATSNKSLTASSLEAIYRNVQDEYAAYQEQYEHETAHGTIGATQQLWEYKIAEELKKMPAVEIKTEAVVSTKTQVVHL
jgi:hypothetical protein